MSSIYRKGGADGYYYYQTYVYNPETGKKDKRIFHSLGTRDPIEAENKQTQLDKEYQRQEQPDRRNTRYAFLFKHKQTMALIASTVMVTVFVLNLFRSDPAPQMNLNKQAAASPLTPEEVITIEEVIVPSAADTFEQLENKEAPPVLSKPETKRIQPKLTIPKHTVVRVESISSVFQQGKIYVTVDEKTSTERLRLLCKSLTRQYPEYSNIVICMYASSAVGIQLAKGTESNFSLKEQNEAWLVLYSYNPVEGDYFDDEPGKYLGT